MFIEPIQAIQSIGDMGGGRVEETVKGGSGFQDVFKTAWNNVKETKAEHSNQQYLMSIGELEDTHTLPIAAAKAEMAVELLAQLRNKALESYDQLIKTSL